jgi:hypothetical protein
MMSVEPIELTASDGVLLRGQRWTGGDVWVILFHDVGRDLDCWQPIVLPLLEHGYSALTLDLRGHGASDGEWNIASVSDDLETALVYARDHGANKIAFIGAGESALPALLDACSSQMFAIVVLSPGPLGSFTPDALRGGSVPKFFVVGSFANTAVNAVEQIHSRATGWLVVMRLPTAEQGNALLGAPWGLHVQEQVVAFLEEHRFAKVETN